jgi:hypothetical protein
VSSYGTGVFDLMRMTGPAIVAPSYKPVRTLATEKTDAL